MSTRIPNVKTVVSYSYTVKANGKAIGTLQGFNPSANRNLERVREIMGNDAAQDTFEIVPGRTEFTISIDRFETYDKAMMQALGYASLEDVSVVTEPISITEVVRDKAGMSRIIEYQDCWIQSWAKTIREGTITVTETVTLWPTRIVVSGERKPGK